MPDPGTLAALGIGASVLGNMMGADSAGRATDDTNKINREMAERNIAQQKEFAQMGIRWKVEDAKAAGIHPLYALGANTHSFSPVALGHETDNSQANMYQNMGQDMSRAIQATRTSQERELAQLQIQSLKADVEGKALDNQIRASTLMKSSAQVGPSLPSPMDSPVVSGQNPGYRVKHADITASTRGTPSREAGAINDFGYVRTPEGLSIVPSSDVKNRIEDQVVPETFWAMRNSYVTENPPYPKDIPLPSGADRWVWIPLTQSWQAWSDKGSLTSRANSMARSHHIINSRKQERLQQYRANEKSYWNSILRRKGG